MAKLNPQQMSVVAEDPSVSMQIIATAGSGKTKCLVARIVRLVKTLGARPESVMLVTFTRNSAEDMRRRLKTEDLDSAADGVLCGTFHSLAYALLGARKDMDAGGFEVHRDEILGRFSEHLDSVNDGHTAVSPDIAAIRHIFVDESQDMDALQYKICQSLVRVASATLTLVGDDCQNIYGFRDSDAAFLREYGRSVSVIAKMLTTNYRSTPEIVRFANCSMQNSFSSIPKRMRAAESAESRAPVRVVRLKSNQELRHVASEAERFEDEFEGRKTIGILCRTNGVARLLETILVVRRRKVCVLAPFDDDHGDPIRSFGAPSIVISTIHGSKGLEFDAVVVPGVSEGGFPRKSDSEEEIEQERRLFIVAITRAKERLTLTFSGDRSRFVSEIPPEYYDFVDLSDGAPSARKKAPDRETSEDDTENTKRAQGVTSIIDRLRGDDYARLRASGILPDLRSATLVPAHDPFDFPVWVKREGCFAEFGSFVDIALRYRVARATGNAFSDSSANRCFLALSLPVKYRKPEIVRAAEIVTAGGDVADIDKRKAGVAREVAALSASFGLPPASVFLHGRGEAPAFKNVAHAADDGSRTVFGRLGDVVRAYKRLTSSTDKSTGWEDGTLRDLFLVSSCKFLYKYPPRLATVFKQPDSRRLRECVPMLEKAAERFEKLVSESGGDVRTDVRLESDAMCGIADVVASKTMEEIKCSSSDVKIEWILQLLSYAHMLRKSGEPVDEIRVYNALRGLEWTLDLREWTRGDELEIFLSGI